MSFLETVGSLLKKSVGGLAETINERNLKEQRSHPDFNKYVSQFSNLSKEELLQQMNKTKDLTQKAALYKLYKRNV